MSNEIQSLLARKECYIREEKEAKLAWCIASTNLLKIDLEIEDEVRRADNRAHNKKRKK